MISLQTQNFDATTNKIILTPEFSYSRSCFLLARYPSAVLLWMCLVVIISWILFYNFLDFFQLFKVLLADWFFINNDQYWCKSWSWSTCVVLPKHTHSRQLLILLFLISSSQCYHSGFCTFWICWFGAFFPPFLNNSGSGNNFFMQQFHRCSAQNRYTREDFFA